MGLARAAVALLLRESCQRPFEGQILTLGRQHVYVTANELEDLARQHGASLTSTKFELHREPTLAAKGYLSDDSLFRSLGFTEVVRLDASPYEECEEIFDLNSTGTPPHLVSRFDVVLDSGTMEHVFDLPAVLRHCCRLVKPRGRVIHCTPSSNCVEHGFYSVSPTLFADFYTASGFDLTDLCLCRIPLDLPRGAWDVFDYRRSNQRMIPLGILDDRIWFTWSVSVRAEASSPAVPQQSFYEARWREATSLTAVDGAPRQERTTKAARLLRAVRFSPRLTGLAETLIQQWRLYRNQRQVRRHALPYPYVGRF